MNNLILPVIVITVMLFIPLPAVLVEIIYGTLLISSIILLFIVQAKDIFPSFLRLSLILTSLDLAAAISFTRIILTSKIRLVLQNLSGLSIHYVISIVIAIVIIVFSMIFINRKIAPVSAIAACFILDSKTQRLFDIDYKQNSGELSPEESVGLKEKIKIETEFFSSLGGSAKFLFGNIKAIIVIYFIALISGTLIGVYQNGLVFQVAINSISFAALLNLIQTMLPLIILSTCINCTIKKHMPQVSVKE